MVGRAIASRLSGLGHEVVVGTRNVEKSHSRGGAGDLAHGGVETYSRLFFELYQTFGTFDFNINVVRPR